MDGVERSGCSADERVVYFMQDAIRRRMVLHARARFFGLVRNMRRLWNRVLRPIHPNLHLSNSKPRVRLGHRDPTFCLWP